MRKVFMHFWHTGAILETWFIPLPFKSAVCYSE